MITDPSVAHRPAPAVSIPVPAPVRDPAAAPAPVPVAGRPTPPPAHGTAAPAPVLIAVAHGSRDPAAAASTADLIAAVGAARPDLVVRPAYLEQRDPLLPDVLSQARREGHHRAVVVPLLLGAAYHATVDVPGAIAATRAPGWAAVAAEVLGPDPRLGTAALHRLADAGACLTDRDLGVLLIGAGSSHPPAAAAVSAVARAWGARLPWAATGVAFASATGPRTIQAIASLRLRGARRIALASWFLAPGLLRDRALADAATTAPDALIAAPLGAHPLITALILDRYTAAARTLPR